MYFIIKYNVCNKYIINVTTTEINTCKKIFEFGQKEVISFFTLVTNKGEHYSNLALLTITNFCWQLFSLSNSLLFIYVWYALGSVKFCGISRSGKRGQFVLHYGCPSELLGPHPPRFTTLFPVLS